MTQDESMRERIQIFRNTEEVSGRLQDLQLDQEKLVAAGHRALVARLDAGPLMAASGPGTLSYHRGVEGLREENLGGGWTIYRNGGLEGIEHCQLGIVVLFQNATKCCGSVHPQPWSPKGKRSAKLNHPTLFEWSDVEAPEMVMIKDAKKKVYYLMVDVTGGMELCLPVIEEHKFVACAERIFLIEGGEMDPVRIAPLTPPSDDQDDLIIEVKRKNDR